MVIVYNNVADRIDAFNAFATHFLAYTIQDRAVFQPPVPPPVVHSNPFLIDLEGAVEFIEWRFGYTPGFNQAKSFEFVRTSA
jgi:hypothetical protein